MSGKISTPTLRKWHGAAAILHAAQAITVGIMSSDATNAVPVRDNVGNVIGDAHFPDVLWMFPTGSVVQHSLMAFVPGLLQKTIDQRANIYRWSEYAVTSSVMLWLILVLSRITDVNTMILALTMNAVMQFCGYLIEKLRKPEDAPMRNWLLGLSWLLFASVWSVIIISFNAAVEASIRQPPDEVYAAVYSLLALYGSFGVVHLVDTLGGVDYSRIDLAYTVLSLVSKSMLVWLTYFGAVKGTDDYPSMDKPEGAAAS